MIRRLRPGYNGGVGALHSHSDDKPRIRYCQRCNDLFGVQARLGPRIRMMGPDGKIEPVQPGDDQYLTCRNCGTRSLGIFASCLSNCLPILSCSLGGWVVSTDILLTGSGLVCCVASKSRI